MLMTNEAHVMISIREEDSKVLMMPIKLNYLMKKGKMANVTLETVDLFSFDIKCDIQIFKVRFFTSDFELE